MTDFNAIVIAFSIGLIIGTIITLRICAWWYGRKMIRIEGTTKKMMAAKLAAL